MSRFRPPLHSGETLAPPRSRAGSRASVDTRIVRPAGSSIPAIGRPQQPQGIAILEQAPTGVVLYTLMGMYVFMHVVPWAEIMDTIIGVNIKIAVVTGTLLTLGALFSGQIGRFWRLSVAKWWMLLLGLFLAASVAGLYRRGSLTYMFGYALRFHTFPFLLCAVAQTRDLVRQMIYWAGAGAFVILILIRRYGEYADGRLNIPNTSLANPNDLALTLLLSAVCLSCMFYSHSRMIRLIPLLALPPALYYVLQTGSRANFLTVVVLGLAAMWSIPARMKLRLAITIPVVVVAMVILVPGSTLERLTKIVANPIQSFTDDSEYSSAIASQMARTRLQERAIDIALRHPLLGVGPWEFADAVEVLVREETGNKSTWQFAHNVYLQMAAENGIPAFFLFAGLMLWALKTNYQVHRAALRYEPMKEYEGQSICLLLLVVADGFGIAFGNYIYDANFPILVGLTAANYMAFQKDLAATGSLPRMQGLQIRGLQMSGLQKA